MAMIELMWQWVVLIIFIICLVVIDSFFWGSQKQLPTPSWVDSVVKLKEQVLGARSVADYPRVLIEESRDNFRKEIKDKTESVMGVINQKTEDVLGEDVKVTAFDSSIATQTDVETVINMIPGNKRLFLKRGVLYGFRFSDIPQDYCVFINKQRYEVGEGQVIKMRFTGTGSFPIKLDYCNPTQKELGEIVVE